MTSRYLHAFLAMCLLALAFPAQAQFDEFGMNGFDDDPAMMANDNPVTVDAVWSADGVESGQQIVLALVFDITYPFHIQPREPELDWLVATEAVVEDIPTGIGVGDIQWPTAHPIEVDFGNGPETLDFYTDRAPVFFKVTVPDSMEPGDYPVTLTYTYQACDDTTCQAPVDGTIETTLRVTAPGTKAAAQHADLFAEYQGIGNEELCFRLFDWKICINVNSQRWLLYLLAALGGFLLNLTPCVLPMIPIKIMGLAHHAGGHRTRAAVMGTIMSVGVVAFWLAIGGAIAFLTGFDAISSLFQRTDFTIGVGILIALMGLGMFGLFTAKLPQWVYKINPTQDTPHGSFGFGIMTGVLATPCTAPFMGTAAGWAAKQSPAVTLATFAAIGIGMALPYLVLTLFPKLVSRVPRSGPAGELVKQIMGIFMIAAGAFFAGSGIVNVINTPPDPASVNYWWVVGGFIALAGLLLAIKGPRIATGTPTKTIAGLLGGLIIVGGVGLGYTMTRPSNIDWVYYTPERLAEAHERGDVVVLDFTANWCLNCHTLERTVLDREPIYTRLNQQGVTIIKVDISKYEPAQQLLADVGSTTIPLLIVYNSDAEEVFRSDAYTIGTVLEALDDAGAPTLP